MIARIVASVLLSAWLAVTAYAQTSTIYGSAFAGSGGAATLYTIDPATGVATAVGPIGFAQVGALAFALDGSTLYGVGFDSGSGESILITIDTATGAGTLVGSLGVTDFAQDIAFRPADGTLFAYVEGSIYTINVGTGAATLVGDTGDFPDGNAIAFQGSTLLLSNSGGGGANGTLQSINQSTGAVSDVVDLTYASGFSTDNPRAAGMKFDPATGTLFAAIITGSGGTSTRYLGTINTTTGAVTDVGTSVAGLDAIAIAGIAPPAAPTGVPTLSEWAMMVMIVLIAAVTFSGRVGGRKP